MYVLLVNSHHFWCGGSNVVDGMVLDRSLDGKIEGSLVSLTPAWSLHHVASLPY